MNILNSPKNFTFFHAKLFKMQNYSKEIKSKKKIDDDRNKSKCNLKSRFTLEMDDTWWRANILEQWKMSKIRIIKSIKTNKFRNKTDSIEFFFCLSRRQIYAVVKETRSHFTTDWFSERAADFSVNCFFFGWHLSFGK